MDVFFCLYYCQLLTRCSFQVSWKQSLNRVMPGREHTKRGEKRYFEKLGQRIGKVAKNTKTNNRCFNNLIESHKSIYLSSIFTLGSSFSLVFSPSFLSQKGIYFVLVTGSLRERLPTWLYPEGTKGVRKAQFLDAPQRDCLLVVKQDGHWHYHLTNWSGRRMLQSFWPQLYVVKDICPFLHFLFLPSWLYCFRVIALP